MYGNHFSNWDPILLNVAFSRPIRFMAKHSLFQIPIVGACCRAYGAFPINRGKADLSAIKTALRVLKNGEVLGIFPEGTRVSEENSSAKGGIAMFAFKSGALLQPVHVAYRRRLQIFNHIEVCFGPAISPETLSFGSHPKAEDYSRIGSELMQRLYRL